MEIDLLVEAHVRRGTLARARGAGVKDALAVGGPLGVAAPRGSLCLDLIGESSGAELRLDTLNRSHSMPTPGSTRAKEET